MGKQNLVEVILENKWTEVVDIFRVEMSNINAGEGGTSEIDIKTIHLEDGTIVPRISPQAIFRMIRDYWWYVRKLPVDIVKEKQKQSELEFDPVKYIDDDLFGYMNPIREESAQVRPGPIRSIGARGLYEYPDDYDFMTCVVSTTEREGGGSMVSKQITTNTFILPMWIHGERIGKEFRTIKKDEIKKSREKVEIPKKVDLVPLSNDDDWENKRNERLRAFFDALFHLSKYPLGPTRQPLDPKLLVIAVFNRPNITIYDAIMRDLSIKVSNNKVAFVLEPNAVVDKLNLYRNEIVWLKFGVLESFFEKTAEELDRKLKEKILQAYLNDSHLTDEQKKEIVEAILNGTFESLSDDLRNTIDGDEKLKRKKNAAIELISKVKIVRLSELKEELT